MKLLIPAIILFIVGIVLAIITAVGYSKAKRKADDEGADFNMKPYGIKIGVVLVLFIAAQILLLLNK